MASKDELKKRLVKGHVITEQDMQDIIDVAGEPGPEGPKGKPGAKGNPGAVGFGTKEQYDEIIERLNALENPEAE